MNNVAPTAPVERFAQLCALLDDGFATRADILAATGLDEAGWEALRAEWLPRLAADGAGELAQQFGQVYARARRYPGYLALPEPESVAEEDTDVDTPAGPDTDTTERTVAGAFPLAGPALPFRVPALLPPPLAFVAEPAPCQPLASSAAVAPADATLEAAYAPLPAAATLPFSAPAAAPVEGMRLQRFDTQTGQPLDPPVWVREPTPPR